MKKTFYVLTCALCTLLVLPAAAQVPAYVPTNGLVGWWPFNGNANDESGNGNDGVVTNALLSSDRFNQQDNCYHFDNADEFIRVPNHESLGLDSTFCLSLWFNAEGATSFNGFLSKASCLNASIPGYVCGIWDFNTAGLNPKINFQAYPYLNDGATSLPQTGGSIEFDAWYHLVVLYDKVNHILQYYLNGELIDSIEIFIEIEQTDLDLIIGNHLDAFNGLCTSSFMIGRLDDIAIYNRALTEQEIQNLYTGQCPTVSTNCTTLPSNLQQGLVGYWPFCGNASDESGNGNDGVVNGATLTEDRFGNANAAYGFDGVDDFISTSNIAFGNGGDYSLSAWVNLAEAYSPGYPQHYIISNAVLTNGVYLNTDVDENQFGCNSTYSTNSIDTWHHYLAVKNGANYTLYIDNVNVGTTTSCSANFINGETLYFGQSSINTEFTHGSIDDIGIWNRALTPEEVQELYTLDACTFTVYDTLTVYETVYDTVYTYETIYDTVTTYVTVTDTLLIDITFVGFEGQPSWLNTVTVFPNPASDHITIDYGNFALMAGYNTIITDAAGATVYSSAVNSQQVEIDINAWGATGVYYMSVYDANGELVAVRHIVLE